VALTPIPSGDPLRDPIWQFVGAIFALIAIATPFVTLLWSRNKKELSYQILSSTKLLNEQHHDLKITYKNYAINDPHLHVIKIINTGNVSIKRDDYDDPITIMCLDAKLYDPEIIESYPENISLDASIISNNRIIFTNVLLNKREYYIVRFLADAPSSLSVQARINDISTIKEIKENDNSLLEFVFVSKNLASYITISISIFAGILPILPISYQDRSFILVALLVISLIISQYLMNVLSRR
jgi:hypothetical protein